MLLNLWNIDMLTKNFMNLYNLTGSQMGNILRRLHLNNNSDCVCIRLIKNSDKYMFEFCPVKIYSGAF